jgi:hypothetical protein
MLGGAQAVGMLYLLWRKSWQVHHPMHIFIIARVVIVTIVIIINHPINTPS